MILINKKVGKVVGICALCKDDNVILENSHIIPKFVTRRILKKSVNGYMRNPFERTWLTQSPSIATIVVA